LQQELQMRPSKSPDCQVTPVKRNVSPTRLEQEEIDRIVDQIVSQLRKQDGNPVELSEQKASI
jgi:hypothetical protein